MRISATDGLAVPAPMVGMDAGAGGQDPAVQSLQRQIEDLQKQLKELSSNQNMTPEMKSKKRQEMQKQISDLEMQLRQRQMEVKRERMETKRQSSGDSFDDMLGGGVKTKGGSAQSAGLSAGSMKALLSADSSMKQAQVSGSVSDELEGRARVLEGEIRQDSAMGCQPEGKKEALEELKDKAEAAAQDQMQAMTDAVNEAEKAAEAEREDNRDDRTEDETAAADSPETADTSGQAREQDAPQANTFDVELPGVPFSRGYQPVDVKL